MKQLVEGVWQLKGFPRDNINIYLLDDVLNVRPAIPLTVP